MSNKLMPLYKSTPKNSKSLRRQLAYLYEDTERAKQVADDAGLNITEIRWSGSAAQCWYCILKEAEKHGKVAAVMQVVLEEYKDNTELQIVWELYQANGQYPQEETESEISRRYREWRIVLDWKAHGKPSLREFDLAGRDLSDLSLIEADLKSANLSNTNLTKTNLARANLERANLHGANLTGASLEGANLRGADLSEAVLYNVNLSRAILWEANLSGANLIKADLGGADLRMAMLHQARIDSTTQLHAKWKLVWEIIHKKITHPDIRKGNVIRINRYGGSISENEDSISGSGDSISGNYLANADLSEANLSYADLSADNLKRANLRGTNLSYATLFMANLEGANLERANLTGANLREITSDFSTQWPEEDIEDEIFHVTDEDHLPF